MAVHETTSLSSFYLPFYPQSTTVITSASNTGKTSLVLEIIKKRNICFSRPFEKCLVVLGNETVNGQLYRDLTDETLTVDTCYFEEFNIEDHVTPNIFLIFEDVSKLSDSILECINVGSHHLNLASIILIVQSVLKDEEFKVLLGLVHRIVIFFSGTGGSKLAKYIQQFLFVSSDIKDYLKKIASFAENNKSIVLFEINPISRSDKPRYFAIANVDSFVTNEKKPIVVFPQLNQQDEYEKMYGENIAEIQDDKTLLPAGSYVLVKVENLLKKNTNSKNPDEKIDCATNDWSQATENISHDIETSLKFQKQQAAKNLARAILKCNFFCVSSDGKTMMIKDEPKTKVALLDYLNAAIRVSGPNERPDPKFALISKYLIKSNTPLFFIKNKSLLQHASSMLKKKKNVSINKKVKTFKA